MPSWNPDSRLAAAVTEFVTTAAGRTHRDEPQAPRTGGPTGNARLTSWTGLLLLVLFAVEGVTLLSLRSLISVHIVVGALLVPPVLLKTATTGWRMVRYYAGSGPYRAAGPPPLVLRLLGPLVVVTTIATLGTGLVLVLTGPSGREPFVAPLGLGVSVLTLHQASVVAWAVVTAIHLLGRAIPALRNVSRGRAPGRLVRAAALGVALAVGAAGSVVVLGAAGDWTSDLARHRPPAGFGDAAGDHR